MSPEGEGTVIQLSLLSGFYFAVPFARYGDFNFMGGEVWLQEWQ